MYCYECFRSGRRAKKSADCHYNKEISSFSDVVDIIDAIILYEQELYVKKVNVFFEELCGHEKEIEYEHMFNSGDTIYDCIHTLLRKNSGLLGYRQNAILCTHKLILRDIQYLADVYLNVRFSIDTKEGPPALICTTPRNIILEGIDFGLFDMYYYLCPKMSDWTYCYAQTPNKYRDCTHPHVKEDILCVGRGRDALRYYKRYGYIAQYFNVIYSILKTYSPGNEHENLIKWTYPHHCCDCEKRGMNFGECHCCHNKLCEDCQHECQYCHHVVCYHHSVYCYICEQYVCDACYDTGGCCARCDAYVCHKHYNNKRKLCSCCMSN
jgi:hypothetical protein